MLEKSRAYLRTFVPEAIAISNAEKLRASVGALLGIFITALIGYFFQTTTDQYFPQLIAPMGASAVLLFALPSSPLAQPWSIMGGNTIAAMIGITCTLMFSDVSVAASVAVSVAIVVMLLLRCLHPPSGAVAITAVMSEPTLYAHNYSFVIIVLLNSLSLLIVAIVFNNLTQHRYPNRHSNTPSSDSDNKLGITAEEMDQVFKQHNQVLDISREDLQTLFKQAQLQAHRRKFGEIICKDMMSTNVLKAEYGTTLQDSWQLLRMRNIKALPVVDGFNQVIGIVTQIDFMRQVDLDLHNGFEQKFKKLIRATTGEYSDKLEVVGQIMSSPCVTINQNAHIVDLITLMAKYELHHIPVVTEQNKLVGIITQSDLLSAIYNATAL